MEEEEEIFTTIVEVHHKRKKRKKRTLKIAQRKFDDFFEYQDQEVYSYENSGHYHDHDYRVHPKITKKKFKKHDPYKAPNPPTDHYHDDYVEFHEKDLDLDYHVDFHSTIYRDVSYYPRRPTIRNPRDFRNFPGNQPAGVLGVDGRLIRFVRRRVNPLAFAIQGTSEHYHGP